VTTTTRVPFNLNVEAATSGAFTVGTVVGGDTAIQTSDGATSYVETYSPGSFTPLQTGHTFEWVGAAAIPPTSRAYIEADWWTEDAAGFGISYTDPTDSTGYEVAVFSPEVGESTHPYGSPQTREIVGGEVEYGQAFLSGVQWQVIARVSGGGFSGPSTAHITRLTLIIETTVTPPMRLMQRGDGLGMGSGRVYSPGTRQGSTRVFGTY
jgi:hypothetical protein